VPVYTAIARTRTARVWCENALSGSAGSTRWWMIETSIARCAAIDSSWPWISAPSVNPKSTL
jgi:hypothetical protein